MDTFLHIKHINTNKFKKRQGSKNTSHVTDQIKLNQINLSLICTIITLDTMPHQASLFLFGFSIFLMK